MLSDLTKKTEKKKSDKTPSFYTQRNRNLIQELLNHSDPVVREATASNSNCPTKLISRQLEVETDKKVLRALLLNPNTTWNAVEAFTDTPNAALFNDDTELEKLLKTKFGASGGADEPTGESESDEE